MMDPFSGRVAMVTGAASGIGRAVAGQLAGRGASVVIADLDLAAAERAAEQIRAAGGKAQPAALDVRDARAAADLVESVATEHGRLDYMFNNAGVGLIGEARDMADADWDRIIAVNLMGVVHGTRAAYRVMLRQGFGHIVNTGSINGLAPFPLSVAYTMTKHAVVGLSASLRAEAAGLGVKVSVVCPGFIDTPMKDNNVYLKMDKNEAEKSLPFKLTPVEKCAREILEGVAANKAVIIITWEARLLWRLYRLMPALFIRVNQAVAKKSRRLRTE